MVTAVAEAETNANKGANKGSEAPGVVKSAREHVSTQATIPETAREEKEKGKWWVGLKNKEGDGGMKRRDGGEKFDKSCSLGTCCGM